MSTIQRSFVKHCQPLCLIAVAFVFTGAVSFERHVASMKKTGTYATSGYFSGGKKSITAARLKDIRRGPQKGGGERIVFDLESLGGSADEVPFFQVNINPEEGRLIVSLWADVTYEHDPARVDSAFRASPRVKSISVLPRIEDGMATIELPLKSTKAVKVEAFYLTHPARIILDLL
jgi:hypothetical protein